MSDTVEYIKSQYKIGNFNEIDLDILVNNETITNEEKIYIME